MRLLKKFIPDNITNAQINGKIQKQFSTRAIVLNGNEILLLYTKRYDDYSLPGGKLDPNEDIIEGLKRELNEETGAVNIHNIQEFGAFEELRKSYDKNYDTVHLVSYCYSCSIDSKLGETKFEAYEIKNGMKVEWINIDKAIQHNKNTLANSPSKGLSVEREIFLLELIKKELI